MEYQSAVLQQARKVCGGAISFTTLQRDHSVYDPEGDPIGAGIVEAAMNPDPGSEYEETIQPHLEAADGNREKFLKSLLELNYDAMVFTSADGKFLGFMGLQLESQESSCYHMFRIQVEDLFKGKGYSPRLLLELFLFGLSSGVRDFRIGLKDYGPLVDRVMEHLQEAIPCGSLQAAGINLTRVEQERFRVRFGA